MAPKRSVATHAAGPPPRAPLPAGAPSPSVATRAPARVAPAPMPAGWLSRGMEEAHAAHQAAFPAWPAHVHRFVRLSMVARGGAKACAIRTRAARLGPSAPRAASAHLRFVIDPSQVPAPRRDARRTRCMRPAL